MAEHPDVPKQLMKRLVEIYLKIHHGQDRQFVKAILENVVIAETARTSSAEMQKAIKGASAVADLAIKKAQNA